MKSNKFFKIILFVFTIFVSACTPEDNLLEKSIAGNWSCEENSSEYGLQQYVVEIKSDTQDSSKYHFDNFYNLGTGISVYGYLDNYDITIPEQTVDGQTISGDGEVLSSFKSMTLIYTANDNGGIIDEVTATYTLQ